MKIGIVGSGVVGATAAYAMVMRGVGREIVLVDKNAQRARSEADDISHAIPFAYPLRVYPGEYSDLSDARVVIIAAGVSQKSNETRLQLLGRNAEVFREVIPNVLENARDAVLVVATNPVDVMTHLATDFAAPLGVSSSRILGSGTTLDTARFRTLLGRHLGVDPLHVHAYVLGEHGDSEVLTWSLATVGGMPLEDFCRKRNAYCDHEVRREIDEQVRRAAYHIIQGKGSTYYGVGSALARIVDIILHNQRSILTVCTRVPEIVGVADVTLSLPHLIGGDGVLAAFPPPLSDEEFDLLQKSARVIKTAVESLYSQKA
ncbi:MAG: L-lactate dehydrogenase [Bacteroidota bacterium]